MADRDHPRTHIEDDKDAELPRKQPLSPQHSGIDPLTEGDTMYPAENTKTAGERLAKKESAEEYDSTADDNTAQTVADQEELNARANTPNEKLSDNTKTQTSEQAAKSSDSKDSESTKNPTGVDPKPVEPSSSSDQKATPAVDLPEDETKVSDVTSAAKSDNSPKKTTNAKDSEGDKLPQTARPTNPSVNDANSEKGDRK